MTTEAAVPVVPEVLTKDIILNWDGATMLKKIKNPKTRVEIEHVMNAPDPDPAAEAEAAETQRLADEAAAAENKRLEDEADAITAQREAEAKAAEEAAKVPVRKKLVVEYQATDASGNKIGRPTHLEESYTEGDKDSLIAAYQAMSEKQRIAHVNATQALENIKKNRVTFAKEEVAPARVGLTEEEVKQLAGELDEDPVKAEAKVKAIRKLSNADAAEQREREAQIAKAAADAERESYAFMKNHINDYYVCDANGNALTDYIKENKLAWTRDNLEIAFAAIESQLAPLPSRQVESVPAAQPPAAPVVAAPPAVAAVVPAVAEPVVPAVAPVVATPAVAPTPEPANPVAPVRRVPNGGIQPGQMSGRPPAATTAPGLTKRDILKMPRDEYRQKIKNPQFRALVNKIMAEQTPA